MLWSMKHKMNSYDTCKETFSGCSVLLVGNGPSAQNIDSLAKSYDRIATVNAGLSLLDKDSVKADLLWIQDGRMLIEKLDKVLPYITSKLLLCMPQHGKLPSNCKLGPVLRFQHLGNSGFSRDPRIGVFTGYNALYGLIQLLAWCEPKKIGIIGMDLDYGRNNPRAYQTKRGFDVDLHVNDQQIAHSLRAVKILKLCGIDIEIHAKSLLLSRAFVPSRYMV